MPGKLIEAAFHDAWRYAASVLKPRGTDPDEVEARTLIAAYLSHPAVREAVAASLRDDVRPPENTALDAEFALFAIGADE